MTGPVILMTGGGEGSTSGPRMPPGTASLRHVSYTNGTVAAAQMDHGGSLNSKPSLEPAQSSAPAPKPFKKRYLAEQSQQQQQQQHQQHINAAVISGGPNSGTPTPTPSVTPTPPVSPVGADTARACEALLELSGGGGGGASGNSSGNRSPASGGTRSPPSREDTNGIDSKIALRKAVWKSVVETASKQKVNSTSTLLLFLEQSSLFSVLQCRLLDYTKSHCAPNRIKKKLEKRQSIDGQT